MEANLTRTISKYPAGAGYFFVRSSEPVQLFLLSSRAVVRSTAAKKKLFFVLFLVDIDCNDCYLYIYRNQKRVKNNVQVSRDQRAFC
jgi:hypothetical protein